METHENMEYSPLVLDHARKPRNLGPLESFNGHARITGPCGDTMEFWLLVRDETVEKASFTTDGCVPSHACGSMATCLAAGKSIHKAVEISHADILGALGGLPGDEDHCALLASNTLRAACEDYFSKSVKPPAPSFGSEEDRRKVAERLSRIRRTVMVLSGKGGVGKSTVAVNLAAGMALEGKSVGLLDLDIHGPSVPTMLGLQRAAVQSDDGEIIPVEIGGLKVISMGFFLGGRNDAVIWRGPMKMTAIRQFISDVAWGELDCLVIDLPPGTGDEPLSICQVLGKLDGAVVVTTPQEVAAADVRRSITFCRQLGVKILGVLENMSGFVCPHCGEVTNILPAGGGKRVAEEMATPFLGAIPMDPQIAESGDCGRVFISSQPSSATALLFRGIARSIENNGD